MQVIAKSIKYEYDDLFDCYQKWWGKNAFWIRNKARLSPNLYDKGFLFLYDKYFIEKLTKWYYFSYKRLFFNLI